jgi:hypothetical protein
LLGGWARPSSHVMQGAFEAIRDEQRGRAIATATESQGWEREPPNQQRASRPAAPASQQ